MDAISFVLGVKSAQLRSSQLRDLVYRGRRLARDNGEGTSQPDPEEEDEDEGEGTAKKAWVLAVFEDEKSKEWLFQRTCVILQSLMCDDLMETIGLIQDIDDWSFGVQAQQKDRHLHYV